LTGFGNDHAAALILQRSSPAPFFSLETQSRFKSWRWIRQGKVHIRLGSATSSSRCQLTAGFLPWLPNDPIAYHETLRMSGWRK